MANTTPEILSGYETTYITRPDLSDEGLKALHARLSQVVTDFGGEVVLTEEWGKRKLAYSIKKEARGNYTYFVYTGKRDVVHEIERNLRLHDHTLRFLTVNLEEEFDAVRFRKSRSESHAAVKRREEEREARKEERMNERRGYGDDRSDYRRSEMEDLEELSGSGSDNDDL